MRDDPDEDTDMSTARIELHGTAVEVQAVAAAEAISG
jgi:hypothetical protein